MRFSFSLVTLYTLSVATFAAGCVDVTCAERGTCAPGTTTEASSDAALSNPGASNDSSVNTGASAADGSVNTSGALDVSSGCVTSCAARDASAWTSSGFTATDGGNVARDGGSATSSGLASQTALTLSDTCIEVCACGSDGCSPSSEPVEAGPPGCSPEQAAECVSPRSICVWENDAPVCVECRGSYDCAAPTGVCVATRCEVCDLVSSDGCFPDAPFCVAVGSPTAVDGGTASAGPGSSLADGAAPDAAESMDAAVRATRACVECRNDQDCGDTAPLCSGGSCVQCLADTDCESPDAPRCDTTTNSCTGCDAVGQCSRFDATPACNLNDGKCVECTAAERDVCEDFACQTTPGAGQYTCSEQELGLAAACDTCVSDAACPSEMACVRENFGNQETEWVCLPKQGDGCAAPLIGLVEEATSVDAHTGAFCKPAKTTCAGYRHYGNGGLQSGSCQVDEDCGLEGVADGFCRPYPTNNSIKVCSYQCQLAMECPNSVDCEAIGGNTFACSLD